MEGSLLPFTITPARARLSESTREVLQPSGWASFHIIAFRLQRFDNSTLINHTVYRSEHARKAQNPDPVHVSFSRLTPARGYAHLAKCPQVLTTCVLYVKATHHSHLHWHAAVHKGHTHFPYWGGHMRGIRDQRVPVSPFAVGMPQPNMP